MLRVFFFLIFIGFTPLSFGLDDEGIAKRAKRLVDYFETYHLKPRIIDDVFGRDVNTQMIAHLDDSRLFFHASDIQKFEELSNSIDDEINARELNYLLAIEQQFIKRANEAKLFVETFFKNNKDLTTIDQELESFEVPPNSEEEHRLRWEMTLIKSIQNDVLRSINDDASIDENNLEEALKTAKERVKTKYDRYFQAILDTEDYFELAYLNAIASVFDPHSSYYSPELNEAFSEELSSERKVFGITYQLTIDGSVEITDLTPGSSAWFSELHIGDIIESIQSNDGQSVDASDANLRSIRDFFSALKTDTIQLFVNQEGQEKQIELVRENVYSDDDVIQSAILKGQKNVGYISLPDFYTNWTDTSALGCANDIAKSLRKLQKEGIDGLILDLRNNGGGSLKEAIDLVGIFINYGPVILEKDFNEEVYAYKDFNRGSIYRGPLMVMINNESASASEIVAGSLQDYNRAVIVGQKSYGKATGQGVSSLDPKMETFLRNVNVEDPSWGYAKVTNIGLYRLSKTSAQQHGIQPDIAFPTLNPYPKSYEKDLPHSIELGSVEKKLYFTPKPELPVEQLRASYAVNHETKLDEIRGMEKAIVEIEKTLDKTLSLSKGIEFLKKIKALEVGIHALEKEINMSYIPESFQFSDELLKIAPFFERYNTDFTERLSNDFELNEAYKLMETHIGIAQ